MSTEYLSKDILDEEFMKMFAPLERVQMALGCYRVDSKHRFVTEPTLYQRIYTIILTAIATVLYTLMSKMILKNFYEDYYVYNSCLVIIVLHWCLLYSNVIHVRFVNSEANAKFYIKLQKVEHVMKTSHNKTLNIIMYRLNLATITLLLSTYIILYLIVCINDLQLAVLAIGTTYFQIVYMLEFAHFTNLLFYFTIRIQLVNGIIINHLKLYNGPKLMSKIEAPTKNFFIKLTREAHNLVLCDIDVYLKELLESYSIFQDIYKFQILNFLIKYLSFMFFTFGFVIIFLQKHIIKYYEALATVGLTVLDLTTSIFVCFRSEQFLRNVKETKLLCITLLGTYSYDGRLREKTKRMLKLLEDNPPRFSVYDMYCLDAGILIKIFGLSTTVFVTMYNLLVYK
ncbi:uncharacterized protein LOC116412714 [Galleria mellonella]|uniref:Uncharacterized protein LOC116412714 n=1 Tax=Galleria mellonella TaxID=7137 RepID=A0A6J3BTS9_GALME|nr:uncharacterized protein LOC116412714 [Galleria mellonella]